VRSLRPLGVALAIVLIAAPILAANPPHRGECKRLTRQMARYDRDAGWAREQGNELWEDASRERVKQLAARRAELCPQYRRRNPFAQLGNLIANAARVAAPYLIPGL
jgi:hypothetical protein